MNAQFVLLPQISVNGYYSYSPLPQQYGTQATVDTILRTARAWIMNQRYPIGIGDMSFSDGHAMAPHVSHKDGRCVDVRPLRTDQANAPVTIHAKEYDHAATNLMVRALLADRNVAKILFNDPRIHGVRHYHGHDNHLHVIMHR